MALGLAVFAAGFGVGILYLLHAKFVFFYQAYMPEVLMSACGRGQIYPDWLQPEVMSFLKGARRSFDCSEVAAVDAPPGIGNFTATHFYLAWVVRQLWTAFGVGYLSLWPLVGALHGAYAAGSFALARLFFGRRPALLVGLAVTVSAVSVPMLFLLRDYSKAPFIIWAVVLLLLLLRARQRRDVYLISVFLAAVIAIGSGFRIDVAILLLPAVVVIVFGPGRRVVGWGDRLAALGIFLVVAKLLLAAIASPVGGGGSGLFIMQGLTEPFRARLGVAKATYDLGWLYSDELTLSTTAGDLRREDPARFDATEASAATIAPQALSRSTGYLLGWADLFVADFFTHALRSAFALSGFYRPVFLEHWGLDVPAMTWLAPLGVVGFGLFLLGIARSSWREAAFVGGILAVLLMAPGLQFSFRHAFHVEPFFLMALLSLPRVFTLGRTWLLRGLAAAVIGLAIIAAVRAGLILYQEKMLRSEIAGLIEAPQIPVPFTASPHNHGEWLAVAVPADYRQIVEGPPDSLVADPDFNGKWRAIAVADRLALTLGGPRCATGAIAVDLVYDKGPLTWQPFSRQLVARLTQRNTPVTVIFPAIYRATQHFTGVAISRPGCVVGLNRLAPEGRLPAVFTAILPSGWDRRALHQGIGPLLY